MNRDLSAHEELRAHLQWLISSIRRERLTLTTETRCQAYLYLLASLGASTYEFLWSLFYLSQSKATRDENVLFVKTDSELIAFFLKQDAIDIESHRALKQLNDFRNLIKRPFARIEWSELSEVQWHLDQTEKLLKVL